MNSKWIFLLCSFVLVSLGLFCLPFDNLVTCQTFQGKKISILSNRPSRNTLDVLMSSPLTTLLVSPANSEVVKLILIQPRLTGVLEVLCHPVREHSGLHRISLRPSGSDLFTGRPKYQQFSQLLWRFNLHR